MAQKKESQIDQIFDHLNEGYSITPLEALRSFGTMRLAAYIHELRKLGWEIITETIVVGRAKKRVAQYSMPKR